MRKTIETREAIAEREYLRAYGALPDSTEEQQAWGLKCSSEDAFYAVAHALYPAAFPNFYAVRGNNVAQGLVDELDERAQDGLEAREVVEQVIPLIDAMLDAQNVRDAEGVGVDVDVEKHDPYFLANMLHELRAVPRKLRDDAVFAVNDGQALDAYVVYADPVATTREP